MFGWFLFKDFYSVREDQLIGLQQMFITLITQRILSSSACEHLGMP